MVNYSILVASIYFLKLLVLKCDYVIGGGVADCEETILFPLKKEKKK